MFSLTKIRRAGRANGTAGVNATIGDLGNLSVGLARSKADIRRAQRLRYRVFYEEMSARGGAMNTLRRRDVDRFDPICDHLLISERQGGWSRPWVVGTYRLLRQEMAERHGGFYSDAEFDIGELIRRHPDKSFLELGRSCVLTTHRHRGTIDLLWRGIYRYVAQHRADVLIGCASFEGINVDALAASLSYLHHYASASAGWRLIAKSSRYVEMNRLPKKAFDKAATLRGMPPLLRAYLRMGARVGQGAVIDRTFGTTDVAVVLPLAAASQQFLKYFAARDKAR